MTKAHVSDRACCTCRPFPTVVHQSGPSLRTRPFLFVALMILVNVSRLGAQGQPRLVFDVASVRPSQPGAPSATLRRLPDGSFSATNQTLSSFLTLAYQIQIFQLVAAPTWVSTERWDIEAKTSGTAPPQSTGQAPSDLLMLRALLEDRFQLVTRREVQNTSVYALVADRNDARLGPQIRRPPDDFCARMRAAAAAPAPDNPRECGLRGDGLGGNAATFRARGVLLSDFARTLSGQVQRIVIDRTGLTGEWDFDLAFTPLRLRPSVGDAALESASIFTALREQLGLKLESTQAPVEVLVIEKVERASPN